MAVPGDIFDRRLALTGVSVAIYLALFVIITYTPGRGMAIAAIIPIVIIAWLYGVRAGVGATLLSVPVNMGLCRLMGLDWVDKYYVGGVGVAGTLIEFFIAAVVGKLHEYDMRTHDELNQRKALEAELLQHRTRLEELVRAKTIELEAANQQLEASLEQLRASQSDIRASRDFMESTFHCAIDGLIVADAGGSVIMANRASEQMLGYGVGELRGRCLDAIVCGDGEQQAQVIRLMAQLSQRHYIENIEAVLKRKEGGILPVELNCRFLKNERNEVTGSVTSVHDITLRKQALEQVRRSRDHLQDIFRATPDTIIVTDSQGVITAVNDAVTVTLGYSPEELVGQSTAVLLPRDEKAQQELQSLVAEFLEKGIIDNREIQMQCKDGSLRYLDWRSIAQRDTAGKIIGSIAVLRDCTARKNMEQELRQAQKMEAIGTLAGGIAHDFNNILTAISGFSDLSLQLARDESLKKYLTYISKASNRARDLVRQILAFSRKTEQEMRPVRMAPLVKEALNFLRASLPSSITIRQHIACHGEVVFAEPTQMHQVLMNLCTNAGYAMRKQGGTLTVALDRLQVDHGLILKSYPQLKPGAHMRLAVSDTGPGIPGQMLEHIFEPYFTTKKKGEGTGLGLAVVHGIVNSHSGTITVVSEPGRGATFEVILPLMEMELSPASSEKPLRRGDGESILFVDDEEDLTVMARSLLEDLGYRVTVTTEPKKAFEIIRNGSTDFDLLITDKTMPGMSGFELAEAVLAVEPGLPVILVTGLAQEGDTEKAQQAGIKEVVAKPFQVAELAGKIRSALAVARPS